MSLSFYAITAQGLQALPIPEGIKTFNDLYDDLPVGVYTVFRTYGGVNILHFEAHLARLRKSMEVLGWNYQLDEGTIQRGVDQVCRGLTYSEARMRVDVLAEEYPVSTSGSRVLLALEPLNPIPNDRLVKGVELGLAEHMERPNPEAKTASFALERKSLIDRPVAFGSDHLMFDEDGCILEGVGSNFYAVKEGVVITSGEGVLRGITQIVILKVAEQAGIPVKFGRVGLDEIDSCSEAMISSASRGLLPVVKIGELVVGEGKPGPMFQKLRKAYDEYVSKAVKPAL